MRVGQPGISSKVGGAGGAAVGRSGSEFALPAAVGDDRPVRGPVAAGPLASLGAILALQDLPDPTERRRRAVRRGDGLLDRLELLRNDLLEGAVTADALTRLRLAFDQQSEPVEDQALAEILAEIELRTAVELAKIDRAYAVPTT